MLGPNNNRLLLEDEVAVFDSFTRVRIPGTYKVTALLPAGRYQATKTANGLSEKNHFFSSIYHKWIKIPQVKDIVKLIIPGQPLLILGGSEFYGGLRSNKVFESVKSSGYDCIDLNFADPCPNYKRLQTVKKSFKNKIYLFSAIHLANEQMLRVAYFFMRHKKRRVILTGGSCTKGLLSRFSNIIEFPNE